MPSLFRFPFGREKDKPLNECNKGSLKYYIKNLKLGTKYDKNNIDMAKECLMYLDQKDIIGIVEELDPSHAAWQMCNDALNQITDGKKVAPKYPIERDLPIIQLKEEAKKKPILMIQSIIQMIDDLYLQAQELEKIYTEYDSSGKATTRSSDHTPF